MSKATISLIYDIVLILFILLIAGCSEETDETTANKDKPAKTDQHEEIIGNDGAPMVLIPAGEFQMGSNDLDNSEKPEHTVYLDAFYIDKYEITNAQYRKFIDRTGRKAPYYSGAPKYNAPDQPIICVTWDDAKAYADWAGKRLPTEAEWEKAARGGLVDKEFVWGDDWPPPKGAGNFGDETIKRKFPDSEFPIIDGYDDSYFNTAPVGKFDPNGYGLYDIAGNVNEWVADRYDSNYYLNSPKSNPTGPSSGEGRIIRGGCYRSLEIDLRVAKRYYFESPVSLNYETGFRCAKSE